MGVFKKILSGTLLLCGICIVVQGAQTLYENPRSPLRTGQTSSIVYVPISTLTSKYFDNTRIEPIRQFSDSFFISAINGLVPYELAKRFAFKRSYSSITDSLHRQSVQVPSMLGAKQVPDTAFINYIKHIANACTSGYVAIPYACTIIHRVYQPPSWRNNGGVYERPISYSAQTQFQMQIYNALGEIVYESVEQSSSGKPVLYSLFKKEKPKNDDLVTFSRQFYAPPAIKALSAAITKAMPRLR